MESPGDDDDVNVNRKLSVYKHIKKKAANDAQLLMNRIALIQKEEERARKKIEQTKEKAQDIIALRIDNEKRVLAHATANKEMKQLQQVLLAKNREQEMESKKARSKRAESIYLKKKEEVNELLMEKKYLSQQVIEEQEKAIRLKQKRRDDVKRMEDEMKMKKEKEKQERERRMKEFYERKAIMEAEEAKKAQKLVKQLEKREKEWIDKLKKTQEMQDNAFYQLENALLKEGTIQTITPSQFSTNNRINSRSNMSSAASLNEKNKSNQESFPLGYDNSEGKMDGGTENNKLIVPGPGKKKKIMKKSR